MRNYGCHLKGGLARATLQTTDSGIEFTIRIDKDFSDSQEEILRYLRSQPTGHTFSVSENAVEIQIRLRHAHSERLKSILSILLDVIALPEKETILSWAESASKSVVISHAPQTSSSCQAFFPRGADIPSQYVPSASHDNQRASL